MVFSLHSKFILIFMFDSFLCVSVVKGMDDMGLWTYDTEIFDELILGDESLLSKNDVILLDMGGYVVYQ